MRSARLCPRPPRHYACHALTHPGKTRAARVRARVAARIPRAWREPGAPRYLRARASRGATLERAPFHAGVRARTGEALAGAV